MNSTEEIGCCAYCGTCREYLKTCKGCKPGYLDSSRELSWARCKMKKCCLTGSHITCADCEEYDCCETHSGVYQPLRLQIPQYKQALEYIHAAFLKAAEPWTSAYGKYPEQDS